MYTLLFFFIIESTLAVYQNDKECLDSSFVTEISHKGTPLGLTDNILFVSKEKCTITVSHEQWKFFKKRWIVDVCRGPIHIKYGTASISVLKKKETCFQKKDDEFCEKASLLNKILQDDGLIFAKGEKEDITSDHGRVYCSYLLLQSYLADSVVFHRNRSDQNILKDKGFTETAKKKPISTDDSNKSESSAPMGKTKDF